MFSISAGYPVNRLTTDNKDFLRGWVSIERYVSQHLVIDKFIALGEHHHPIQKEHPSKLESVQDLKRLEFTLTVVDAFLHFHGDPGMRSMFFRVPDSHLR